MKQPHKILLSKLSLSVLFQGYDSVILSTGIESATLKFTNTAFEPADLCRQLSCSTINNFGHKPPLFKNNIGFSIHPPKTSAD